MLDKWSGHVTGLKCFLHFEIEFESTTSIEVNGPDLDAVVSSTHSQIQARELDKIKALSLNLLPNAPAPELIRKSNNNNAPQESQCCTSFQEQSD